MVRTMHRSLRYWADFRSDHVKDRMRQGVTAIAFGPEPTAIAPSAVLVAVEIGVTENES